MTRAELEEAAIELIRELVKDIPDKIAPAVAAATSPAECESIIRAAFLEALAGFEDAAPGRRN
jgi:hypothetical protein